MRIKACSLFFILFFLSYGVVAENSTRTGGYTIHHNAITTDSLSDKVASAYGIKRSKTQALLNISVLKDQPGAMGKPVKAKVSAKTRNLFGRITQVPLREVTEGQAIYYIGDFPVAHREILMFDFDIMPEGGRFPLRAHMRQEFYTN